MSESSMDFYAHRKRLIEARELYHDPDFLPEMMSISPNFQHLSKNSSAFEWKRPTSMSKHPKFVTATASRSDLEQGELGNCWFVAAASILVNGPKERFERVVPLDQGFDSSIYAGMFRFKFWWHGEWKEVVIDDFLPTNGHIPVFCRNGKEEDEYWGALLEKAYAKLRGSYAALVGGFIGDALVDLTGGIGEAIMLDYNAPSNLYDLLMKSASMDTLIGASIHIKGNGPRWEIRKSNGLYMGHGYSVTGLAVVPYNGKFVNLLRVRNPWGRGEWNGPWSDSSPEMQTLSQDIKREMNIIVTEDGEFWIAEDDFLENFDECFLCYQQPDAVVQEIASNNPKLPWKQTVYHDSWERGVSAGGSGLGLFRDHYWMNPQFFVRLKDPDSTDDRRLCTMIVSLAEKGEGLRKSARITCSFSIFRMKKTAAERRHLDSSNRNKANLIFTGRSGPYSFRRDIMKRFELPPGDYVIIPSTFFPGQEAKFMLRIFVNDKIETGVLDEDTKNSSAVTELVISSKKDLVFSSLYGRYAGDDNKMDYKELGRFLSEALKTEQKQMPASISGEVYRILVALLDNRTGFLDFSAALRALHISKSSMAIFKQFDRDNSNSVDTMHLWTMLKKQES